MRGNFFVGWGGNNYIEVRLPPVIYIYTPNEVCLSTVKSKNHLWLWCPGWVTFINFGCIGKLGPLAAGNDGHRAGWRGEGEDIPVAADITDKGNDAAVG